MPNVLIQLKGSMKKNGLPEDAKAINNQLITITDKIRYICHAFLTKRIRKGQII